MVSKTLLQACTLFTALTAAIPFDAGQNVVANAGNGEDVIANNHVTKTIAIGKGPAAFSTPALKDRQNIVANAQNGETIIANNDGTTTIGNGKGGAATLPTDFLTEFLTASPTNFPFARREDVVADANSGETVIANNDGTTTIANGNAKATAATKTHKKAQKSGVAKATDAGGKHHKTKSVAASAPTNPVVHVRDLPPLVAKPPTAVQTEAFLLPTPTKASGANVGGKVASILAESTPRGKLVVGSM